jgi:hypothetical protein
MSGGISSEWVDRPCTLAPHIGVAPLNATGNPDQSRSVELFS